MTDELRALVADDEPLVRAALIQALRRIGGMSAIVEVRNGLEAAEALRGGTFDIAFLDIRMPGLDGFEVIAEVPPGRMPAIIFITAHEEYALRAFEARAIDYVLKPIDDDRIARAVERARDLLRGSARAELEERLRDAIAALSRRIDGPRRIAVRLGATDLLLDLSEIDYIEGERNYARLHAGGRALPVRETMATLEERLADSGFVRIHRSTIVNLDRVREIRRDARGRSFAVLRDGTRLRVSDAGREKLAAVVPPPN